MEFKPYIFGLVIVVAVFLTPDIIMATLSTQGTMSLITLILGMIYIKISKNRVSTKDCIKATVVVASIFSIPLFFSTEGTTMKQVFYPMLAMVVNSMVVFIPLYIELLVFSSKEELKV